MPMNLPTILRIAVPSPLRQAFDYLPPKQGFDPAQLKPGMRIKVPWRSKTTIGILLDVDHQTSIPITKLKHVDTIIDAVPVLPAPIMNLAQWAADYYQYPIGEVMLSCLPKLLRNQRLPDLINPDKDKNWQRQIQPPDLNALQQQAINSIVQNEGFKTYLLDGVTGSGKTEVYLQVIEKKLAENKQALVLVPEIGLTPQTVTRFAQRFTAPIVVLHSNLTDRERLQAWQMATGGEAAIIIGTRSAIFTPMLKPGIIILDEEHDLSFKQQSGFRYSARDLAIIRAQLEKIPVVLGSATPSLESFYNSERQRYHRLCLPKRAGIAATPNFQVLDIRNQYLEEGLSKNLLSVMTQHLQRGNQVLLFLNRRGFSSTLLCHSCGWIAQCQRCDARLTLHQQIKKLSCHHCDGQYAIPAECKNCQSKQLLTLGVGTERLEKALQKYFVDTPIIRIDRDTTRHKGAMQEKLQKIQSGQSQILIGTQMLTKGHHFPDVTLVAIIDADYYLFSNDFRASERLGQLLIQVAGRAGRAEKKGEVLIQTHHPEHPLLQLLLQQGYAALAQTLLKERQATRLPPFSYMALLRAEAVAATAPMQWLTSLEEEIHRWQEFENIQLLGPMPALMEKKAGRYRAQLFFQAKNRQPLHLFLKRLLNYLDNLKNRKVRWSLDIDPLEIF